MISAYPKRKIINVYYSAGWLIPAIGALGMLGGGLLNSEGQKSANKTNLQIAREQNAWNLQQWERENAYNTPSAQLQRLKDAGLNPNLMYGSGQSFSAAASSPRAASSHVQNENAGTAGGIASALQFVMQSVLQQSELQKMQAQSDLIKHQADLAIANKDLSVIRGGTYNAQTGYYNSATQLNVSRSEMIKHQIQNIDANTVYLNARNTGQETYNRYAEELFSSKVDLQKSMFLLNDAQREALAQKIAQSWTQLGINQQNADTNRLGYFNQKLFISNQIRNLKTVNDINEIKKAMLGAGVGYAGVNAFFDSVTKALKPLKGWLSD